MYVTTTRRPVDGMQSLRHLSSMLDDALGGWQGNGRESGAITAAWAPAVDVFESGESVKIVAELPGVKAEDVTINLESNLLTIRGEKRQQAEESSEKVHRYERTYGMFERSFALPSTVNADAIQATVADGVLTVELPKAEKAKPRRIEVTAAER